jgi:hypothetical protein
MKRIREIQQNNIILARYIPSYSWNKGLSFFSKDKEYIQLGTWRYDKGKELLAHIHNKVERNIYRTQEVLFIKKGKIMASIYNLKGKLVKKLIIESGDILVLLNCGHGYEILQDDTQVIEIKNGPYLGAEIDRRRI